MKTSITITMLAVAAAIGAIGLVSTLGTIQIAHGDPQTPHGTCRIGDFSGHGATGCVGNVGGFIITPNGNCHATGRGGGCP